MVIGTSAGGVEALPRIFKDLPEDFPAAILVVMHLSHPSFATWLSDRLAAVGPMRVKVAENGETVRQGTAYIAPAGTHLLVEGEQLSLGSGPREQHVRPAIDALFRSAAHAFGPRVIGVVLTGALSDGTLGLRAVREAGGITIVQDPEHAHTRAMPTNAMNSGEVDHCVGLEDIAPLLELLVRRAGSHKRGALETGLALSLRFMHDRLRLLTRLGAPSRPNDATTGFFNSEIASLKQDIARLTRLIR